MPATQPMHESQKQVETRSIDLKLLRFDAVPMQFLDAGELVENEAPIRMLARSAEPIEHWYWGQIVHDMTGMQLRKERVPIDWCHDETLNLGYLDHFEADNEGLRVSGKLIAFQAGDRASEIIHRGRKGVPYEASIDFTGPALRIEELGPGVSAEVNGREIEGPAIIVREWNLRAVAVCPYGADSNTISEFNGGQSDTLQIEVCQFSLPQPEPVEPTRTPTQEPIERSHFANELGRYVDAFGGEYGVAWFKQQLSFHEAMQLHNVQLKQQLVEKQAQHDKQLAQTREEYAREIAQRDATLKAVGDSLDEEMAASFRDADRPSSNPIKAETERRLGKNLARFVSGIKLPFQSER